MDQDWIEALIRLVGSSGIAELELQEGTTRLRIVRTAAAASAGAVPLPTSVPSTPAPRPDTAVPATPGPSAGEGAGADVLSPMVGTFYRRPSPDEPPFVEVGSAVSAGQTLALIEAMKTLNPVMAERAGTVRAVLAGDAEPVAEDQRLFVIG